MKYDIDKMFEIAEAVRNNAYAPYSNFKVGACIFAQNGEYYSGCNVENTSYPCAQCAEASAIGNMVALGGKKIIALLVITDTETGVYPCGMCLQKMSEFMHPESDVIIANLQGIKSVRNFREFFNNQFGEVFTELKNL